MKLRSVISGLFILLVLFSGSRFMVGMHICSGHIQNVALFGKAEGCEMEKQMPPCHRQQTPCCEDKTFVHDAEEFQKGNVEVNTASLTTISVAEPLVILAEVTPSFSIELHRFYAYDPPLRSDDLTVAFQSFLI